jgi:hypothetical protein
MIIFCTTIKPLQKGTLHRWIIDVEGQLGARERVEELLG